MEDGYLYGFGFVLVMLTLGIGMDALTWFDQWLTKRKATPSKRQPFKKP